MCVIELASTVALVSILANFAPKSLLAYHYYYRSCTLFLEAHSLRDRLAKRNQTRRPVSRGQALQQTSCFQYWESITNKYFYATAIYASQS